MKDLSVLRNELYKLSILSLGKNNSYRFNYHRECNFQEWLFNNRDKWNSYVSEYESEEELIFYLLRPRLIKGQIFCENCGKLLPFIRIRHKNKTCCEECRISSLHSNERNKKFSDNWRNKSDDELKLMRSRIENTMLEKYGVRHNWCYGELRNKEIETWKKKYGVEHPGSAKEVRERIENTKLQKYGDKYYTNRDKAYKTMIKRYGSFYNNPDSISKTWQNKPQKEIDERTAKTKQTNIKRYGTETPWFVDGARHVYVCDNISFDSSDELYFYLYHKRILCDDICRGRIFSYEFNGRQHKYFCDFLVNNENIEIKGAHLFKDGKLYFPYINADNYEECQHKLDAKYECMLQNNVRIILSDSDEMREIISIVKERYGEDYIKQFDTKVKQDSNRLFEV